MARTVETRELKSRLGTYLRLVRAGHTLVVTDRGRPVAELAPLSSPENRVQTILEEMAAEGRVTLPKKKGKPGSFKPIRPRGGPTMTELISAERDGRH